MKSISDPTSAGKIDITDSEMNISSWHESVKHAIIKEDCILSILSNPSTVILLKANVHLSLSIKARLGAQSFIWINWV